MITKIGQKYKNIHTGIECVTTAKTGVNIQYIEDLPPKQPFVYCPYESFQKNWIMVE